MQRLYCFCVALNYVVIPITGILRPPWILRYLNEQVSERTSFTLYACTAYVPCATMTLSQCRFILANSVFVLYWFIISKLLTSLYQTALFAEHFLRRCYSSTYVRPLIVSVVFIHTTHSSLTCARVITTGATLLDNNKTTAKSTTHDGGMAGNFC